MTEKTWRLEVIEEELKALISYHASMHNHNGMLGLGYDVDRSERIHDLTKRLNKKNELKIEKEEEPQPAITEEQAKVNIPAGW